MQGLSADTQEKIRPIEEVDPEFGQLLMDVANGRLLAHIEGNRVFQMCRRGYSNHDFRYWTDRIFREVMLDVGRNDPCPICVQEGIKIKAKKCKKHKWFD